MTTIYLWLKNFVTIIFLWLTFFIIPRPGYFYRGNICECPTCTDVCLCDWSESMVHWFCLSVQLVTPIQRLIESTDCVILSVSHTPNQALLRTLEVLNLGLRPLFNITECSQLGLVRDMGHWYNVVQWLLQNSVTFRALFRLDQCVVYRSVYCRAVFGEDQCSVFSVEPFLV